LHVHTHRALIQVRPKPSDGFSRRRAQLGSVLFRQRSSKEAFTPGSLHPTLGCYSNEHGTCCQRKLLSESTLPLSSGRAGRACRPQEPGQQGIAAVLCPTGRGAAVPHRHGGFHTAPSTWVLSCQARVRGATASPSRHSPAGLTPAPVFSPPSPRQPLSPQLAVVTLPTLPDERWLVIAFER